ncbi:hypothetical protein CEXT_398601 [Caerostris extrusa]|uniref:Uncharacterized protein n=1 Tax=Caerostris extrusa TaxID=172846 RepID=A0AAV4WD66_CAEEX|nr:hypothetical protein CEXT_398601 [Caerostris extrusa]
MNNISSVLLIVVFLLIGFTSAKCTPQDALLSSTDEDLMALEDSLIPEPEGHGRRGVRGQTPSVSCHGRVLQERRRTVGLLSQSGRHSHQRPMLQEVRFQEGMLFPPHAQMPLVGMLVQVKEHLNLKFVESLHFK